MSYRLGPFLREKRGDQSLRDFAAFLGISHTYLDSLEKGVNPKTGLSVNVSLDTLKRISDIFGVTIDYLAGRVENPMEKLATPEDFAGENIGEEVSTVALSRSDNPDDDLPEEAQKQIEDFRAYIRQKYKKPE